LVWAEGWKARWQKVKRNKDMTKSIYFVSPFGRDKQKSQCHPEQQEQSAERSGGMFYATA